MKRRKIPRCCAIACESDVEILAWLALEVFILFTEEDCRWIDRSCGLFVVSVCCVDETM
jgi:hypothetical protein